jgi:hypothetical protein
VSTLFGPWEDPTNGFKFGGPYYDEAAPHGGIAPSRVKRKPLGKCVCSTKVKSSVMDERPSEER